MQVFIPLMTCPNIVKVVNILFYFVITFSSASSLSTTFSSLLQSQSENLRSEQLSRPHKCYGSKESFIPSPIGSDSDPANIIVLGETLWSSRRKIIKKCAIPILKFHNNQKQSALTKGLEQAVTVADDKSKDVESMKNNVILSSAILTITILVSRLGGRMALMQIFGLEGLISDENIRQIDEFISLFQSLDPTVSYGLYLTLWFLAKALCIDAAGVALAFSAGILFNGLLPGVIASVTCSSLGALGVFLISRYLLRERAVVEIEKRPALRAIDRACMTRGFQTIFTLRLSPILPIPIGAYNYLYGASSVSISDFLAGTSLGAIKPYLLDCYLGLLAKDIIEPQQIVEAGFFTVQDLILFSAVLVVTLVGTYATQITEKILKEIQIEIDNDKSLNSDVDGSKSDGVSFWSMIGVDLEKDVPKPLQDISLACDRINLVINDEINVSNSSITSLSIKNDTPESLSGTGTPLTFMSSKTEEISMLIPRVYLFDTIAPQSFFIVTSERNVLVDRNVLPRTYDMIDYEAKSQVECDQRKVFNFEAQPLASSFDWNYQYRCLTESSVFGVLLLLALFNILKS